MTRSFPHPPPLPPSTYCPGFSHHQAVVLVLELHVNGITQLEFLQAWILLLNAVIL